ncbi:DNA polymerase III subunit gamma/tau [bacterium]|nr:DNA polymerase III subunit gamma/tau [bacterium]MBT4551878.1 DNA polymerase III subunit gamma/tau [bacterium]
MSHTTFYRKYRSETFVELVGQEHIKQTLSNAIKFERLSHAYIFSGPRGTGKTSVARILAKSLNCEKGKSDTPCLTCKICQKIAKGNAVDVIEIDAASNTGVDNIRDLNDRVNYMPIECRYKIYIIDEAHMLSTGAFNALLKTLEEPPQNTLFILATTEPHKIPITIHSRCQKLNFRRLSLSELVSQLQKIATAENIQVSEKGMQIIAKNASGCMRDAISLLDQLYSFKGNEITDDDIIMMLGTLNFDSLYDLISNFLHQNIQETILNLNKFIEEGININQLVADIRDFFRHLLFIKMDLQNLLEFDNAKIEQLHKLAHNFSYQQLQEYLEIFAKTEMDLRWASNPELLLQVRFLSLLKKAPVLNPKPLQKEVAPITTPAASNLNSKPHPVVVELEPVVEKKLTDEAELDPNLYFQNWQEVLGILKKEKPSLYLLLADATFINLEKNIIYIALKEDYKFHQEKIKEETSQIILNKIFSQVYNRQDLRLALSKNNLIASATDPSSSHTTANAHHETPDAQKINQIIEIFEGKLV